MPIYNSQGVLKLPLEALQMFQQEIKVSNTERSVEQHDELLSALFLEIRKDLGVSPSDNETTFKVGILASGVSSASEPQLGR